MTKFKTRTLQNGVIIKAKDQSGQYGNCTDCGKPLFSMEFVYNNGVCNPCLGKKGNERNE